MATQPLAPHLAASFGPDRAVQAPEPGFSGRGQSITWPTHALNAQSPTDSIFASFGQHVVYERGQTPFAHDGPAARHLAPAPTRRRAPDPALTQTLLERRDADPGDIKPPVPTKGLGRDWAAQALTPARINRLTIGRRPGAMEVSTASLTLAGRQPERPVLLDGGWPGTGRPADTAPVLSHALRTPRSTVLPPDPEPNHLERRRRTYLSRADVGEAADGKPKLLPFEPFDDPRDVIRLSEDNGTFWRIDAGGEGGAAGLRIGPAWQGTLRIRLMGHFTGPVHPLRTLGDPRGILGLHRDRGLIGQLAIGHLITQPNQVDVGMDGLAVIMTLTFPNIDSLQERLAEATADTHLSLTLKFPHAAGAEPLDNDLDVAPAVSMDLPLTLDPGGRRVVRTRTRTIAFGDPAYDRVLASQAALDSDRDDTDEFRAAADRREYNSDSTMLLAFGQIDPVEDVFDVTYTAPAAVTFQRVPFAAPGTTQELELKLSPDTSLAQVSINAHTAVRLRLADLRVATAPEDAALSAGDTLIINLAVKEKVSLTLRVRVVAAPVIAPPASVYSVIETVETTARTRLHAPGSLPTRIEFPDLLQDLARGHVRRDALFVWHFATPAPINPEGNGDRRTDLIKLDRSGGGQLP
ncbi:hypothetical protein [Pararhodobacter sp. SW119]|uniref:hypothetical protein n=1 Tax=Pararhodobacter sp. SW119 TaxID=2780075 RepID=UPI001AE0E670|nr:hypothetical protein [Pararhodobacter sp. SW119]